MPERIQKIEGDQIIPGAWVSSRMERQSIIFDGFYSKKMFTVRQHRGNKIYAAGKPELEGEIRVLMFIAEFESKMIRFVSDPQSNHRTIMGNLFRLVDLRCSGNTNIHSVMGKYLVQYSATQFKGERKFI
jgi:hypothetical protein